MNHFLSLLIQGIAKLISLLPYSGIYALGKLIGLCLWYLPNNARRITLINIRHCFPELSSQEQKARAKASILSLGHFTTETCMIWFWPTAKLHQLELSVSNEALVTDITARQSNFMIAIPHLGAFEYTNVYLPDIKKHVNTTLNLEQPCALYKPSKLKALDAFIKRSRERFGIRFLATTSSGLRTFIKTARSGTPVALLPDHVPEKREFGTYASFFSQPALTSSLTTKLLKKGKMELLYCFIERTSKGYHVHFRAPDETIYSDDQATAVQALNNGIEQCIKELPHQYLWSYKRFKKQPRGMPDIYAKTKSLTTSAKTPV